MHCINEHFLEGCHFDEAYPNPCQEEHDVEEHDFVRMDRKESGRNNNPRPEQLRPINKSSLSSESSQRKPDLTHEHSLDHYNHGDGGKDNTTPKYPNKESGFNREQQLKLRSIATRGGLLDILVENTLLNKGARIVEPFFGDGSQSSQERIVIYLLMAMIVITTLVTVAMTLVVIFWVKSRTSAQGSDKNRQDEFSSDKGTRLSAPGRYVNEQLQHYPQQYHHNSRRQHPYLSQSSARQSAQGNHLVGDRAKTPNVIVTAKPASRRHSRIDSSAL